MLDLSNESSLLSAAQLLKPTRLSRLGTFVGKALGLAYALTGQHRYDDFRLERVQDVPILVTPSVFNPKLLRTGAFFASQLDARSIRGDAEVLDMGTGSGVCAVFAAKHARRVVAVDINGAAVRCASINARLNQLEHRIETRQGDLFAPVTGERFDLVLFNPPFLSGSPRDDRDRAWRSSDVAERFGAGLGAHLKPGASALVLLSSFGDAAMFLREFRKQRFGLTLVAERRFVNERLAIFRLVLEGAESTA
jgi:release factor glutamine methyltransferase